MQWQPLQNKADLTAPFIFLFNEQRKSIFVLNINDGLFQYDYGKNIWNKHNIINNLPEDFFNFYLFDIPRHEQAATIHANDNKIYFLNQNSQMAILHIDEEQPKWIIQDEMLQIGFGAQGIIINNEYHIIGGYNHPKHIKYNEKLKKFEELHDIKNVMNLTCDIFDQRIIKISNSKYLMFGGFDTPNLQLNGIHQYDTLNNQWIKLKLKTPTPLDSFGCTKILCNQYIILFGGYNHTGLLIDNIWIYSILNKTFKESKLKCPQRGKFKAFTINDKNQEKIVTHGFIRDVWTEYNMNDQLFPPKYLINIIQKYYINEFIHLFDESDTGIGKHWRIDVFEIFK